jgi:hypothetical protein
MALVDGAEYNTALPRAPDDPVYDNVNDPILGVSVGWADLYSAGIPGQWVEVTGLPNGEYWLEVIADPLNRIAETNDANNTTRIKVTLSVPPPIILPGDYNDDDAINAADYVVWRKTLGQNVPAGTGADGDGNGIIQQADLAVWRAEFGGPASGGGSSAAPEPSGAVLFFVSLAWLAVHRARPAA